MNLDFGPKHDHRSSPKKRVHTYRHWKQTKGFCWLIQETLQLWVSLTMTLWSFRLSPMTTPSETKSFTQKNQLSTWGQSLYVGRGLGKTLTIWKKQRFVESKWGPTWFSASTGVCHNHWRNPAIPINFDVTRWFMVDSEYPCFPSLPVLCEIEQDFGLKWCPSQQKSKQPALVTGADTEWLVISSNPSEKYAQDVKNGNLPPIR